MQSWDVFFRSANAGQATQLPAQVGGKASFLQSHGLAPTPGKAEKVVEDHLAVQSLIRAYQVSAFWVGVGRPPLCKQPSFLSSHLYSGLNCCLASDPKGLEPDSFSFQHSV